MQTEKTWNDVSDTLLRSWRARGYSVEAVQKLTKIPLDVLEERYYLLYSTAKVTDPSEEEIAERCAAIQREWSETERQRRSVYKAGGWTPTVVPASVVTLATSYAAGYIESRGHMQPSATWYASTATRRGQAG